MSAFDDAMEAIRLKSEVLMNSNQWNRAWELNGVRDFIMGNCSREGFHTAKEWNKGYEKDYLRGFADAQERIE